MIELVGVTRIPSFSGERLRTARIDRKWSQGRLAAVLDVRSTTIGAWERGLRTPEPPTFLALAEALSLEPGALLAVPAEHFTLAELRVTAGLHQRDVATQLGVKQVRISNVESGYERLSDEMTQGLARAYSTTPDHITSAWERGRARLLKH